MDPFHQRILYCSCLLLNKGIAEGLVIICCYYGTNLPMYTQLVLSSYIPWKTNKLHCQLLTLVSYSRFEEMCTATVHVPEVSIATCACVLYKMNVSLKSAETGWMRLATYCLKYCQWSKWWASCLRKPRVVVSTIHSQHRNRHHFISVQGAKSNVRYPWNTMSTQWQS